MFDIEEIEEYAHGDGGKYTGDWKDDIIQSLASQLLAHLEVKANNHVQLERVGRRITGTVLEFFAEKMRSSNHEFYAKDIVEFVDARVPKVAPNSATRVMQNARKHGVLNYELLSRSKSHYRALPLLGE